MPDNGDHTTSIREPKAEVCFIGRDDTEELESLLLLIEHPLGGDWVRFPMGEFSSIEDAILAAKAITRRYTVKKVRVRVFLESHRFDDVTRKLEELDEL
jgi:hypothetical protein